jgi:hypothetical protein
MAQVPDEVEVVVGMVCRAGHRLLYVGQVCVVCASLAGVGQTDHGEPVPSREARPFTTTPAAASVSTQFVRPTRTLQTVLGQIVTLRYSSELT